MPDRRIRVAVILTAGLLGLVLTGCGGGGGQVALDRHGFHGTYVDPPYAVPAVALTDDTGAPFTLSTDGRDLDIVFFGYTNCPDICKLVMSQLTSAYLRLPEAARKRVRVVFVTTDPARDDQQALTTYLARYDSRFTGLTGRLAEIQRLARPLGIFIEKGERLPSGGYAVEHTTSVVAVAHGEAPLVWSGDTSATHIAADVLRLLESTGGAHDTDHESDGA